MRQGYCYTCLAIGWGISVGSLRKKSTNPNYLVRLSSGGGFFHVKVQGPKSSACPSKPRETKLLGGTSQGCPESLRNKSLCSIFGPYLVVSCNNFTGIYLRCHENVSRHPPINTVSTAKKTWKSKFQHWGLTIPPHMMTYLLTLWGSEFGNQFAFTFAFISRAEWNWNRKYLYLWVGWRVSYGAMKNDRLQPLWLFLETSFLPVEYPRAANIKLHDLYLDLFDSSGTKMVIISGSVVYLSRTLGWHLCRMKLVRKSWCQISAERPNFQDVLLQNYFRFSLLYYLRHVASGSNLVVVVDT